MQALLIGRISYLILKHYAFLQLIKWSFLFSCVVLFIIVCFLAFRLLHSRREKWHFPLYYSGIDITFYYWSILTLLIVIVFLYLEFPNGNELMYFFMMLCVFVVFYLCFIYYFKINIPRSIFLVFLVVLASNFSVQYVMVRLIVIGILTNLSIINNPVYLSVISCLILLMNVSFFFLRLIRTHSAVPEQYLMLVRYYRVISKFVNMYAFFYRMYDLLKLLINFIARRPRDKGISKNKELLYRLLIYICTLVVCVLIGIGMLFSGCELILVFSWLSYVYFFIVIIMNIIYNLYLIWKENEELENLIALSNQIPDAIRLFDFSIKVQWFLACMLEDASTVFIMISFKDFIYSIAHAIYYRYQSIVVAELLYLKQVFNNKR